MESNGGITFFSRNTLWGGGGGGGAAAACGLANLKPVYTILKMETSTHICTLIICSKIFIL